MRVVAERSSPTSVVSPHSHFGRHQRPWYNPLMCAPGVLRCGITLSWLWLVILGGCSILNKTAEPAPPPESPDAGMSTPCGACVSAARCFTNTAGLRQCATCLPGSVGTATRVSGCDDGEYCLWLGSGVVTVPEPICVDICAPLFPCTSGACTRLVGGPEVCVP